MKPSGDGSPPGSAESCLRNLRIDLCNLIVESRTPGITANGYGEGVHCPSVSGANSHRCNLASAECQRYQKLLQHLQLAHSTVGFEVDVILLPECCLKDTDYKLSEKVSNQEYLLLERWHMNICPTNYAKPVIDVHGLLRAIRSFLHFSQLSAWLSLHQGKSPANVHYRLSVRGEPFSAKFDCKPEVHLFPCSRVTDNLFGIVKVSYRPRTLLVPIIPCAKHCKVKEDIASSSQVCSSHVIPLKISNKNDLLFLGGSAKQCSLGSNTNYPHSSKWNRNPVKSVFGKNSFTEQSCSNEVKQMAKESYNSKTGDGLQENKVHSSLLLMNSADVIENTQTANVAVQNVSVLHPSQEKNNKRKQNKKSYGKVKCKIKRLSLHTLAFNNAFNSSERQNVTESSKIDSKYPFPIYQENEQHLKSIPDVISDENLKSKNTFSDQGESSHSCDIRTNHVSKVSDLVPRKRKFSQFCKDNEAGANASPATLVTYQEGGGVEEDSRCIPHSVKQGLELRHVDEIETSDARDNATSGTDHKKQQQSSAFPCKKLQVNSSVSRVLRDVKNTSENIASIKQKCALTEQEQLPVITGSRCEVSNLPSSNTKCGTFPLPSSPIPVRKSFSPFSYGTTNVPVEKRRALFQEVSRSLNSSVLKHQKLHKGQNLLGNFEESILHGRLQPVNTVYGFTAEIGASGSFCPDHMTLPAKVFFYELNSAERGASPYMGHINLKDIEYHVPKKGAVQVTLFNPHGTVVKVFIVNYDLSHMPPMCHTFVRQRTFYMPTSATEKDPSRKFLRYIIHLRFASSKSGKIFLHKDFKVIIINKSDVDAASIHSQWQYELRSFIQIPTNPRFSALS